MWPPVLLFLVLFCPSDPAVLFSWSILGVARCATPGIPLVRGLAILAQCLLFRWFAVFHHFFIFSLTAASFGVSWGSHPTRFREVPRFQVSVQSKGSGWSPGSKYGFQVQDPGGSKVPIWHFSMTSAWHLFSTFRNWEVSKVPLTSDFEHCKNELFFGSFYGCFTNIFWILTERRTNEAPHIVHCGGVQRRGGVDRKRGGLVEDVCGLGFERVGFSGQPSILCLNWLEDKEISDDSELGASHGCSWSLDGSSRNSPPREFLTAGLTVVGMQHYGRLPLWSCSSWHALSRQDMREHISIFNDFHTILQSSSRLQMSILLVCSSLEVWGLCCKAAPKAAKLERSEMMILKTVSLYGPVGSWPP